jgi:hypothetical protein
MLRAKGSESVFFLVLFIEHRNSGIKLNQTTDSALVTIKLSELVTTTQLRNEWQRNVFLPADKAHRLVIDCDFGYIAGDAKNLHFFD